MSDNIHITTNNVPRDIIDAWQLSAEDRAEFDYIDWGAIERGEDSASFVRYKGTLYDLGDMMSTRDFGDSHEFRDWHQYVADTFFSGVLFRYASTEGNSELDSIVCARYYVS